MGRGFIKEIKDMPNPNKLLRFTARNHITDRWLKENPDVWIECWGCGTLIHKDDPRRKFCHKNCAKRYWRKIKKVPIYKYCDWCGDEFIANRSDKIYDDVNCLRAADRKRRGIPVLAETEVECNWCGVRFIRTKSPAQTYCKFQCFMASILYRKRLYHVKTRGAVRKSRYDNFVIPKNRVEVTKADIAAATEALNYSQSENNEFNRDAWVKRAKEVEARISARYT